jgi:drug/metabolite transporter (DMT)-like permease
MPRSLAQGNPVLNWGWTGQLTGPWHSAPMPVWFPLITLWLVWGSTYLGIAVLIQTAPGLLGNGLRFLVAAALLAGIVALRSGARSLRITRDELAFSFLMGVMLLGVGIGTLAIAQNFVPSGVAALIVAVIPLWVVIFRLRAGQRPALFTLLGVLIGFIGLAVLVLPGGSSGTASTGLLLGSLAICVSAFTWAYFSWKSRGFPLPRNTFVTTVYELLAAGLLLTGIGAIAGQRINIDAISTASLLAFGYLTLASIVGFSAYSWLLANASLSLTSTYAYVNPVVAVLLGTLILNEVLSFDVIVGLIVITGGVALVVSGESLFKGKRETAQRHQGSDHSPPVQPP